jgi:hypothetical protein
VLAAAGTLLLLVGYQISRKREIVPAQPAAPSQRAAEQAAKPATSAPAAQADALVAARAVLGPDGEVLAEGDFPAAGGRQVLAAQRMPAAPGLPTESASPTAKQDGETTAVVIRVSVLVLDQGTWKEAFRADEHLKNRRGYLPGAPAVAVPAWRLAYSKTPESGFRLEFTPVGLPPGRKQSTVYAAWNGKRGEYDALKPSGSGFLETLPTPGSMPVPVKP